MKSIAEKINVLGRFCGTRDVEELTPAHLRRRFGIEKADVMVLFGGSILCGGDVLARAMRNGAARRYVIVGGEGHTTQTLREKVWSAVPGMETGGLAEAELFDAYLRHKYGLCADLLECRSTNCGNNITNLLDLLRAEGIGFESIILCQDASMQRRMDAGLRKHAEKDLTIINYAAYAVEVRAEGSVLAYDREIPGMWDLERYISLLMGEIPRLTDDANGYGPRGRDFIAHVEVPPEVREAFEALRGVYAGLVREANPLYASK